MADKKRELFVLYASMLLTRAGFGSILMLFPLYVSAGSIAIGVALATYPLAEFVAAVPVGRYIDIKGRRLTLISGLLSISILTMGISLTRDIFAVSIIHGLMGISAAAVTVSSLTMLTDLTVRANRGMSMGTFDFTNIVGYALGIAYATTLLHLTGDNYGLAFVTTGGLLLAATITCTVFVRETHRVTTGQRFAVNPLTALDSTTRAILPLWFGLTSIVGVVFVLPKSFYESGLGSSQTGITLSAGAIGIGLGSVLFGKVSDRIGREKTLSIGLIGMIILLISTTEAAASNPPKIFENLLIIGPAAFVSSAIVPSALAYVGDRARTDLRGSAMGIYSMMLSIGIAAGNIFGGYSNSVGGLKSMVLSSAILLVVCIIVSGIMLYRSRYLKQKLNPLSLNI